MQEDFSCLDTALYLSNCKAHYPISDKYENNYPQKSGRWWDDWNSEILGGQRIHVITYLGSCYRLRGKDKDSMKHVWSGNGLRNAAGLIWLLEALGAEEKYIENAYNAGSIIGELGLNQLSQSKKIKETVPWEVMRKLLSDKNVKKPQR